GQPTVVEDVPEVGKAHPLRCPVEQPARLEGGGDGPKGRARIGEGEGAERGRQQGDGQQLPPQLVAARCRRCGRPVRARHRTAPCWAAPRLQRFATMAVPLATPCAVAHERAYGRKAGEPAARAGYGAGRG